MLTKNEISTLNLSPTKKDFVQIWNELLDVAGKLSDRWDPTSTNESDPGIVILKALAGIADKLNYNIDKNTLEAFMPTAAQEDSMRKLCDMLGYNMKYYRSAETEVTIKYYNADPSSEEQAAINAGLEIPKFTVITNADKDISYFTTNQVPMCLSNSSPSVSIKCMEGQIVKCESTVSNNVITLAQLTDGNKFYLPETQIAENGIFIYNVANLETTNEVSDGATWEKVDNLNIQARGSRVFKFGYNSYDGRPYVEFPDDCSELINDGLFIYYARTSGANGNVSVNTLTQVELPTGGNWSEVSAESFSATNVFAATSGANLETIGQAYNSFKKTVGTFETLVTCRDYMNKIYTMVSDSGKPYVSNVLVTDIRNDLNRAITICSCDDAGIFYKETPLTETITKVEKCKEVDERGNYTGNEYTVKVATEEPLINHFDLVIYPFKSYTQIRSISTPVQPTYDSSFTYTPQNFNNIEIALQNTGLKTIAHNFKKPQKGDILSINNYLRLNAIVGTNNKVSAEEVLLLKERIKIALANAFNMRELDFGEEIPFESIVDVIEHADSRIRVVSLNEPDLYTTFTVIDEVDADDPDKVVTKEYAVASENWLTTEQATASKRFETDSPTTGTFDTQTARKLYNKLIVRNILAGRVPLFKYNTTYASDFSEKPYQVTNEVTFESIPEACQTFFNKDENKDAPYLLWNDKNTGDTYARELLNAEAVSNGAVPEFGYTKAESPKEPLKDTAGNILKDANGEPIMSPKYPNNIIEPAEGDKITRIESECIIKAKGDRIEDIKLAPGEQIKFRAPNFRTKETYPAYVNYHLQLAERTTQDAAYAEARNLYSLMTHDLWVSLFNSDVGVITQELKQEVIKGDKGNQIVNVDIKSLETILFESGCIKLKTSPTFSGIDSAPANANFNILAGDYGLTEEEDGTVLVHSFSVLNKILDYINTELSKIKDSFMTDWTISYEIKYVPVANLASWENFVKDNRISTRTDSEAVLWRKYTGSYYAAGKYVLSDGSKLLPFTSEYIRLLDINSGLQNRLQGIYIASYLGVDAEAAMIPNDTEYKLRDGEYLFIKYTPSSTSEDGTSDSQPPVTKIIKNTVIRPSGFESGLKDSTAFSQEGNTPVMTANFKSEDGRDSFDSVPLYSLGVNEQIEIREPSEVTLDKDTFADSIIYVYKNFNNCPELETIQDQDISQGKRSSTYILKDGEYFFYTDKNKSELAYYSAGTGVTVTGTTKIPTCDIIDISTILDNGISEIPWKAISLTGESGITFKEYQYKTLSQDDILNELQVIKNSSVDEYELSSTWRKCDNVYYTIAGETQAQKLPVIDISEESGNGWEAQSLLEINASPSIGQTLRHTDQVQTKITLYGIKNGGRTEELLKVIEAEENYPLSFKTNVTGQSNTGELALSDVYLNPNTAESFTFKVTAEEIPSILNVQKDTVIPMSADMTGNTESLSKGVNSWSQVLLKNLGSVTDKAGNTTYEALKLSTTILPNTYGLFSIYLKPNGQGSTYLKLLPGAPENTIAIFNDKTRQQTAEDGRLELKTGLNCIRVNKSCEIYIASDASDGLLCFDNLRLVDVSKIDDNQGTTCGLNLDQLGYLSTSDKTTWNEIDSRARKNLKKALTEEALQKVETRLTELKNNVTAKKAALDEDNSKVATIVKFLNNAINELNALIEDNSEDNSYKTDDAIADLITQFNNLTTALTNEKDLQKSLEDSSTIEDITKRLAERLEGFDDISALQESLTAELTDLYNSVLTNAETLEELPAATIVDDFVNAITPANSIYKTDELLKNALKIASLIEINAKYGSQLDDVLTNIDTSNDEHIRLAKQIYNLKYREISSLISDLYSFSVPEDTEGNQILVGTISDAIETTISKINTEMAKSGNVDYSTLKTALQTLKTNVKKLDIAFIVDKINSTAAELAYPELAQYLNELQVVFSAADSALIKAVDQAIELVDDQEGAPSDTLKAAITTIDTAIWEKIKESGATIITEIQDILDELDNFSLDNSILDEALEKQLSMIIAARASIVNTVDLFSAITDYNKLPFSTEAILKVWPEYMKEDLLEDVEPLYSSIRAIVRDLTDTTVTTVILTDRPVLQKLANIKLFKKLYKQAKDLAYKSEQVNNRKDIVEVLSNSALAIPDVIDKLNAFTATSNNQVIYNLATQLKTVSTNMLTNTDDTNNVVAQQQLLAQLKEELAKLIKLDEDLLKITVEMLSPSILLLEGLPQDGFYQKVKDFINGDEGIRAKVLAQNLDGARADIINKLDAEHIRDLLPESYTDKEVAYNEALALIPSEEDPTKWDIFRILLDTELKAAWKVVQNTGNSYWIDSAGAKVTLDNTYKYKYDNDTWYSTDDNIISFDNDYITTHYADDNLQEILTILIEGEDTDGVSGGDGGVKALGAGNIPESFRSAFERFKLEEQLLAEINEYDKNGLFYYNTPVEAAVAIDFNEGDSRLNTLMNPATNYDINNVNNSFVISKLDIGYLDSGIQIARSSRL